MSSIQVTSGLESWVSFLRSHAAITRQLNADLLNDHGLTLSDYEVLLRLANAENEMMRRVISFRSEEHTSELQSL